MSGNKEAAIRKRQQIDSSKRTMFFAVAGAAFVSGIALVVAFFLVQQIIFHAEVIGSKQATLRTIKDNIAVIDELKENVRVLEANEALNSVKVQNENSALQTILDSLPSEPNADALGASLQIKFVGSVDGLRLETLSVDNADRAEDTGVVQQDNSTQSNASQSDASQNDDTQASTDSTASFDESGNETSIGFNMVVSGSADQLKELLARFERSIRVIRLDSIDVEAETNSLRMTLVGKAFYEPGQVVELGKKVIKP